MENICCIILAAGLGKRMGGDLPKALVRTRQMALIEHVLSAFEILAPSRTVIVTGHKRELLEEHVRNSPHAARHSITYVHQTEQLGTGHAVKCALPALSGFVGTIVITYADAPLFTAKTLRAFLDLHTFKKSTLSLISFTAPPPSAYGRVIRKDANSDVLKIIEARDCSPEEALVSEVNSGVYAVDSSFLKPAVDAIGNSNAQKEYYLTDIVAKASNEGQRIVAYPLSDATEAAGVNTPGELGFINRILEQRQVANLMADGVVVEDPATLYLDPEVRVAAGTRIGPNVQLRGATSIASGVSIEGTSLLRNTIVHERATVKFSCRIEESEIGVAASVGPFAHVRPGCKLGPDTRIGNFVETKNATLNDGAKASHLTYLGDCTIGTDTNIGAGTITCNYDGYKKSKTTIGAGVFVGSNSALVAPLTIGDGALIAAGSTITSDVPADALGVARGTQQIKAGWAKRRRDLLERKGK